MKMAMCNKKLTVIIPCYNEAENLSVIVDAVLSAFRGKIDLEILIVDDCSSDGSYDIAKSLSAAHGSVSVLHHETNQGKGAALKTAFMAASGDYVCIQDADLEYDPRDYLEMLAPVLEDRADVVLGSRYLQRRERRVLRWWHTTMNRLLTLFSNIMSDMTLSDMETCYKLFKADVIREIAPLLREKRFGFEPECVAYVAKGMRKRGWRIVECAVGYRPRTFKEGKKIGWLDGVRALWCILKYNLFVR